MPLALTPPSSRDDESALLVPVRDADALAVAVAGLGVDLARRRLLAERGRQVVRRHGDFNRELDRAVRFYEELLAAGFRRPRRGSARPDTSAFGGLESDGSVRGDDS